MHIVFFDLEGTGLNPYSDRIVEVCLISDEDRFATRVNPGVPIPADATAVHGITDADVAGAPSFAEIAPTVQRIVGDAVLAGYNIRLYDTVLIDSELRRAGQPGLPRDEAGRIAAPEIDLYALWQRLEPRTLTGAARRFAGVDLEGAHAARADTEILPGVLRGMTAAFGLDGGDIETLVSLSIPEGAVDRDGKFRRREDGVIVFNFSQQRGQPVSYDPGLLEWMLRRDFSQETKAYASAFLDAIYNDEPVGVPA